MLLLAHDNSVYSSKSYSSVDTNHLTEPTQRKVLGRLNSVADGLQLPEICN